MGNLVSTVFDVNNLSTVYDWAITADKRGAETLVETSIFSANGKRYEYILGSLKQNPADNLYTISEYLTLTVSRSGEEIVYIDLGADGTLESVYVNDTLITDVDQQATAQTRYESELSLSQTFLSAAGR